MGRNIAASTMTTIIYARVSTADQSLDHQQDSPLDYATDDLGIAESEMEILADEATGTDTDRPGYRQMLKRVRDGEVDRVIVREVTRLGRTMRTISENVHEIVEDHDTGLNVQNDNLEVEPGGELLMNDKMILNVLAWAAEIEAKKIRENTIEGLRTAEAAGKWVGRPPYGFTTDADGYLQPTGEFGDAVEAIRAVEDLGWSHGKAARHTGAPRRTVPSLVENREMYLSQYGADDI
jgi:DNA invertase Pin-like site-specific DNA recombinase